MSLNTSATSKRTASFSCFNVDPHYIPIKRNEQKDNIELIGISNQFFDKGVDKMRGSCILIPYQRNRQLYPIVQPHLCYKVSYTIVPRL